MTFPKLPLPITFKKVKESIVYFASKLAFLRLSPGEDARLDIEDFSFSESDLVIDCLTVVGLLDTVQLTLDLPF